VDSYSTTVVLKYCVIVIVVETLDATKVTDVVLSYKYSVPVAVEVIVVGVVSVEVVVTVVVVV
jgi:hypothetical protein